MIPFELPEFKDEIDQAIYLDMLHFLVGKEYYHFAKEQINIKNKQKSYKHK